MWPFDGDGTGRWLALYLLTWALHFVFVGYVLVGSAYAFVQHVRKADDPIAARVRDVLPFMLGAGITAGVAPLLFLQLLYQRHFYTANLLAGPRWGAVVPALIVGFYALYLAKSSERWRRLALGVATLCFVFVAWSWTELHMLARDEAAWSRIYAAGDRLYGHSAIAPRLALWLGVFAGLFAAVAAWWTDEPGRRRLAVVALGGRAVALGGVGGLVVTGVDLGGTAHGWAYLLAIAVAIDTGGWIFAWRTGRGHMLIAASTAAMLLAGAVVREAPRLALLEPARAQASGAGGFHIFVVTALFAIGAITWIWRTIADE